MSLHCTETIPWKRWPFLYPSLIQSYDMGKNPVLWASNSRFVFPLAANLYNKDKIITCIIFFFLCLWKSMRPSRGRIQRKTWRMGPYAGVDYKNLTLCPLQSRLQHIYHGQPYMPESTVTLGQSRLYPQGRDFEFSLSSTVWSGLPNTGNKWCASKVGGILSLVTFLGKRVRETSIGVHPQRTSMMKKTIQRSVTL